jgi:hypothetical protein
MTIDEFCRLHSGFVRDIASVMQDWHIAEIDGLLDAACKVGGPAAAETSVVEALRGAAGDAVIVGDALRGGALVDQIPKAVQDAFVNLMGHKADSLSEMRQVLLSHLKGADGSFRSFDDRAVMGFISKLKGQIGENLFRDHVGHAASLATSGSQEGWDVAVQHADGAYHYVQVKLYGSASGVVRHMLDVQQKALDGMLTGKGGEAVNKVFFAVPHDIRPDVLRLAGRHDGLAEMVYEKGVPISAKDASGLVTEGMASVGPERLTHFFSELLCGAVAAGALHAAVNGFLMYKESKELSAAVADTITDTLVSSAGIGIGLLAESLIHSALMSSAVGIGTRFFIGRVTRSRWDFAEFLENSLTETEILLARLAGDGGPG